MVLTYERWKSIKDQADKITSGVANVADAAVVAALAEIPIVGSIIAWAIDKGLHYSVDQIIDMIPHEYPAGIGYVAGDPHTLTRLYAAADQHQEINPANITQEKERIAREAMAAKPEYTAGVVPPQPLIIAPFGLGAEAVRKPQFHPRKIARETRRMRKKSFGLKPAINPYGVGAIVPPAIHPRQISGI